MAKVLDLNGLTTYHNKEKQRTDSTYVRQEAGKGLSSNDFTDAEKTKLDNALTGIATTTNIGGIKSSSDAGKINVGADGVSSLNGAVLTESNNTLTGNNIIYSDSGLSLRANTNNLNNGVLTIKRYDNQDTGKIGLIEDNIDQLTIQSLRGNIILKSQGNVDVKTKKVVNLGAPTDNADAANKQYVDNQITTVNAKDTQQDAKITANETAIAAVKAKVDSLNSIVQLKGRVDAVSNLPSSDNQNGDLYLVGAQGAADFAEYVWDGTKWEKIGDTSSQITSYNALADKPQIGGVELTGNKTPAQLGLLTSSDLIAITDDEINALF